jgi:hypothetical protein
MNKNDPIPLANRKLKESLHNYVHNKNNLLNSKINNAVNINLHDLDKKLDPILNSIPDVNTIFSEALKKIENKSPNLLASLQVQQNFSECLKTLEQTAFDLYLQYQVSAFESLIELWVSENEDVINQIAKTYSDPKKFAEEVCKRFYPFIQRMEFRAAQKRKARGGGTFQIAVEYLLRKIQIPCEKPAGKYGKILKRIDLVIPDQKTAIEKPDQALFISAKRTLRERWKQTIPERKPSWRVFLITLDQNLSVEKANEINSLGMIVYVRDELASKPPLKNKSWIRSLSDLPKDIKH